MYVIHNFCHNFKSVGKKTTAVLVLMSIFLVLFLALNFHIWSGGYTQGSLEEIVIEQETLLGDGLTLCGSARGQITRDRHEDWKFVSAIGLLPFLPIIFGIIYFPDILFVPFFSKFFYHVTLCNLAVRMNR